ncbi:MAG: STAS domain-containing protein [Lachnospiraceae bacterium]|nr:STAS domain-containing protein [Lachnospiraceae bacterium]
METRVSLENGVLTLAPSGKLNAVSCLELHDKMMTFMPQAEKLIFDFADVDYVTSAGLRELLIAYEEMSSKDGIAIRNVNDEVMSALVMTGFDSYFEIE